MPAARKRAGGGTATRKRTKAAEKPVEAEAETTEEGEEEATENGAKRQRSTEPFPSGEELYNAKYVDGMTWQEIRDSIDARIRSPKGLSLIATYVIENGLEDEHPEFSDLSELDEDDISAAIVEWHDNGQGWAVLAARTGMSAGEVRDAYEEAGGENPGRVGGQRYGGGRSKPAAEEGEGEESSEAEAKPAAKKRASTSKRRKANPSKAA
jgi:hypothetical protein